MRRATREDILRIIRESFYEVRDQLRLKDALVALSLRVVGEATLVVRVLPGKVAQPYPVDVKLSLWGEELWVSTLYVEGGVIRPA